MSRINRRRFATSALASLVLAPFLKLEEAPALAAGTKTAKRLLLFCTMGTHPDLWKPTTVNGESSFTFSEMTQPLADAKQHIVLVDGLVSANPGDNHAAPDGLPLAAGAGERGSATNRRFGRPVTARPGESCFRHRYGTCGGERGRQELGFERGN